MKPEVLDRATGLSGAAARLFAEINFSDRVLAAAPERLAVLKVSGIQWNDLGEPNRVLASFRTAGVRPRWIKQC
jgi:hypothetical protein